MSIIARQPSLRMRHPFTRTLSPLFFPTSQNGFLNHLINYPPAHIRSKVNSERISNELLLKIARLSSCWRLPARGARADTLLIILEVLMPYFPTFEPCNGAPNSMFVVECWTRSLATLAPPLVRYGRS